MSFVNIPSYAPYAHSPTSGSVVNDDFGGGWSPNSLFVSLEEDGKGHDVREQRSFELFDGERLGYVGSDPAG